ncbi:DMT family transporter [Aquimarina sp. ERC-38]|uniref:DMT family transporter n=1 Tax=Aquimarina sp. ERC-38 TaxID=2949996 RepID=UPI00224845F9|nr:DMT family transporter [Aquimarina sp. ERC-38]UZO79854.1 DMT family transporter [Aquimarina sp. ERC-38]
MQNSFKSTHLANVAMLNLAMLLISTSGTLGRYIDAPVFMTIFLRAVLGTLFIFLFCKIVKKNFKVASSDLPIVGLSGFLMGAHWITYFYALQLSNVAIGMLSIFTYPVITSFLEPIFLKSKFQKMHLLLAFMVMGGIYFLVPSFSFENQYFRAISLGVLSAFCYALRNVISKQKIGTYDSSILMFYQLVTVSIFLLPVVFVLPLHTISGQLPAIVTLALVTTAIGHTLFLQSFTKFSITTASIISSTQPIYGIIIGAIFLNEIPQWSTIIGGILILGAVIIESIRSYPTKT